MALGSLRGSRDLEISPAVPDEDAAAVLADVDAVAVEEGAAECEGEDEVTFERGSGTSTSNI